MTISTGASRVADQVSSFDATQATAGKQPTLVANALNGKAALSITGAKCLLHAMRLQPPCTVAALVQTDDVNVYATIGSWSAGLGGIFMFACADSFNQWGLYANANVLSGTSVNAPKKLIAVVRAYNDVDLYTDGVKVTITTGVSAYATASTIGAGAADGSQNLNGLWFESVAVPRVATPSEVASLNRFWLNEYAV